MAARSVVNEAILEDKLVDLWPDYSCLYDVSSQNFKKQRYERRRNGRNCEKVGRTVRIRGYNKTLLLHLVVRHFECRASKSREQAKQFDGLID